MSVNDSALLRNIPVHARIARVFVESKDKSAKERFLRRVSESVLDIWANWLKRLAPPDDPPEMTREALLPYAQLALAASGSAKLSTRERRDASAASYAIRSYLNYLDYVKACEIASERFKAAEAAAKSDEYTSRVPTKMRVAVAGAREAVRAAHRAAAESAVRCTQAAALAASESKMRKFSMEDHLGFQSALLDSLFPEESRARRN